MLLEPLEPRLLLSGAPEAAFIDNLLPDYQPTAPCAVEIEYLTAQQEGNAAAPDLIRMSDRNEAPPSSRAELESLLYLPRAESVRSKPIIENNRVYSHFSSARSAGLFDALSEVSDKVILACDDSSTDEDKVSETVSYSIKAEMNLNEEVVRQELVFVDTAVANYQQLVNDLVSQQASGRKLDVVLLDNSRDGIDQISEALTNYQDLDAVHVVSHGTDARLQLGNTWLSIDNLDAYTTQFSDWSRSLKSDADLLLYGCDLAGNLKGQALLGSISALTGADVAASDDLTGNLQSGGDWVLEYDTGEIETAVAFSPEIQQNWRGVLAAFTVNDLGDTVDANPGDGIAEDTSGNTTLRAAIMEADAPE